MKCVHGDNEGACGVYCGRCRHPCADHVPWGHGALCIGVVDEECNCRNFTDEPTGLGAMSLAIEEQGQ